MACVGLGTPSQLPTAGGSACASALAARSHAFVLCSCGPLNATARVHSDAFDSSGGAAIDGTSAAIGMNGGLQSTAEVSSGGAIYVAGSDGIRADGHLETGRSLRVAGPLAMLAANANIAGDAYIGGDISGSAQVGGVLYVPANAAVGAAVQAASIVREVVTVAAPCPCDVSFVDVSGGIYSAAARNDNTSTLLGGAITAAPGAPVTVSLPCGTFHVSGIDVQAGLTLSVHGHVVLGVTGDVVLRAGLTVTLDPGADLDLLVEGQLLISGEGVIGNSVRPAAFRIWIAGSQSIVLDDAPVIGATIYAPAAPVVAAKGFELFGALLAASVTFGDELSLHYDRALLSAGTACGELPVPSPP